ncbi:TetR/AcrR family transcriptional regulator [Occultella aeris]|uniref:Bacterial regulatory proteins, tetR family n=1 Tax=Occultella aeris TaxID=2761496 RepID=A0A7M4DIT9_9MICO|nr:TetR/AcrR family transcriptional regulator [Occultella aeris]VZO36902.1 Bacterial regulatory proteins, tetR family [Occultella aeris]
MSGNDGDLRVRRTRRMLRAALADLVAERGYEAVSITALTERALVNRTTFYAHYRSKYDLLVEVVGETFRPVREFPLLQDAADPWRPGKAPPAWLIAFLTDLDREAPFYRGVLGEGGSERLRTDLRIYFAGLLEQRIGRAAVPQDGARVPPRVVAMILAAAALGSLTWWLEQDPRDPPELVATWYLETVAPGALRVIGSDP